MTGNCSDMARPFMAEACDSYASQQPSFRSARGDPAICRSFSRTVPSASKPRGSISTLVKPILPGQSP